MIDSHDTNLPLPKEELENVKPIEITETPEVENQENQPQTNEVQQEETVVAEVQPEETQPTEADTEENATVTDEPAGLPAEDTSVTENTDFPKEETIEVNLPQKETEQEESLKTEEEIKEATVEEEEKAVEEKKVVEEETTVEEDKAVEEEKAIEEETTVEEEATVKDEAAIEEDKAVEEKKAVEEEATVEEEKAVENKDIVEEEPAEEVKHDKKSILAKLKEIAQDAEKTTKQEIDNLKQLFYKLHNTELEAEKSAFIEQGGTEETFFPTTDEIEVEFKSILTAIREKRGKMVAEQEKQKEENLVLKLGIIDKLKELVESPEDTSKSYNEFKRLQQQWNEIRLVPQSKVNELWKGYQLYVEKFYDILKLNNEFREYDFKKNLEIKLHLCEAAEKLADEPDVVSAFHQLQKLHQEFRDTGPVAKDLRNDIWNRFKAASTVVNRRHQKHFEELKASEQFNLDQKTVICEIVESLEYDELKTFRDWENKTQEVIALQSKWKTIGFAPQKMNVKIFERFRKACDEFFRKKGEFFRQLKEEMHENLEKKKALCEKAEALKDSTDWKETADVLSKLQKEWKTIGPVQKKHSDVIWKRFIGACDYFFEQKNKANSSQKTIEIENLKNKRSILEQLEAIDESMDADEAEELVRELMKEWNTIGHVPFRDKDKIYKQYHACIDELFERFNLNMSKKKLSNFKSNISSMNSDKGGPQSLYREREKLQRSYDNIRNELQTYENNLGFLNTTSGKGNSLLTEVNRKIEKLKADLELVQEKIKVIDESIREQE